MTNIVGRTDITHGGADVVLPPASPDITDIAVEAVHDPEVSFGDRAQLLGESALEHLRLAERQRVMGRFFNLLEQSQMKTGESDETIWPSGQVTFGIVRSDGERTHAMQGKHVLGYMADNKYSFTFPTPAWDRDPENSTFPSDWPGGIPRELSTLGASWDFAHHRVNKSIILDLDRLRHVEELETSDGQRHVVFDLENTDGPFAYVLTDQALSAKAANEIGGLLAMQHPDWEEPDRFVSEA